MTSARKRKTPGQIVETFAAETGLPGIPKIAATKRFCRFIWTLWMILLLGVFVWQCSLLVVKFYTYPTNVNIKFGTEEVEFPAVTVCNLNRFRRSMLEKGEGGEQFLGILKQLENETDVTRDSEVSLEAHRRRREVELSTCPSWLLLGPNLESKPAGLRGLKLIVAGQVKLANGPFGLKAWGITRRNYVIIESSGELNFGKDSFTLATFFYQKALVNGPIVEWRGSGAYGTHFWIKKGKVMADLNPLDDETTNGTAGVVYQNTALPIKTWSFIGVSFNRNTKTLTMWVNNNVMTTKLDIKENLDMEGRVFLGVRPTNAKENKFVGKLAGTTIFKCAISNEREIKALKKHIIGDTSLPASTTAKPVDSTTTKPDSTTTKPDSTTTKEVSTSTKPQSTATPQDSSIKEDSKTEEPIAPKILLPASTTTAPVFIIKPDKYYSDAFFNEPEPDVEKMPWYKKRTDPFFSARGQIGRALAKLPGAQHVKMSHQPTDFIQELTYNGEVLSPGDMKAFTSDEFGVCYTFNARSANETVRRARKPGPARGVSITMFIEQDEYIGAMSPAAGVKVVIHDNDARPFPYEQGIDIAPGKYTSIGLTKTHFIREVPPYGKCTNGKDKPFKDRGLLYKANYTTVACERSCLQYYTIDVCGCADHITPAPEGTVLCEQEQDNCVRQVSQKYRDGLLVCDCPLPCKEDVLQHSISVSQWPSLNYQNELSKSMSLRGGALKKVIDTNKASENLLKTSIFFETLSFQTFEEERSYLLMNLLSDIGGQSGLWVGLSVLSGLEIMEFLYIIAKCLLRLTGTENRREKSTADSEGTMNLQ